MDVESVRSGHSERSDRSHRSHRSRHGGNGKSINYMKQHTQPQMPQSQQQFMPPITGPLYSQQQMQPGPPVSMPYNMNWNAPSQPYHFQPSGMNMPSIPNPYHPIQPQTSSGPLQQYSGQDCMQQIQQHPPQAQTQPTSHQESERIEVQILPQDDNWGETTTALTGATSETGVSVENISKALSRGVSVDDDAVGFDCARTVGIAMSLCMSLVSFLSPIVMVVLPKLEFMNWKKKPVCEPACEGQLISLSFKLLILLLGTWGLFFRRNLASMPRVFIFRSLILFLVFVVTFAFWLFYGVRILEKKTVDYYEIVIFAVNLTDALLFLHYLAIILLEIRHLQTRYSIKVVRSPDGESHIYRLGEMSVQRAAVFILQCYMTDFQAYNPYLANAAHRRSSSRRGDTSSGKYKFYGVDGNAVDSGNNGAGQVGAGGDSSAPNGGPAQVARSVKSASSRGSRSSRPASERYYEEAEYEKRVRKRKARLMAALDEAFTHIKKDNQANGMAKPMDPFEAAQAIFPTILKPLQKYLRITRQQPRHTMEAIIDHLSLCLTHNMGPKAFVEKYLSQGVVIEDAKASRRRQTWTLLCDTLISRGIRDGSVFQLRQNDISLLVTVKRIPFFSVAEEILDPKNMNFVFKLNSETSV